MPAGSLITFNGVLRSPIILCFQKMDSGLIFMTVM